MTFGREGTEGRKAKMRKYNEIKLLWKYYNETHVLYVNLKINDQFLSQFLNKL